MRLWGRMCNASITRMTLDAPRGCHELEPAVHSHASTPCRRAATTSGNPTGARGAAAAHDADARRLVGLAHGGRLPAVTRTAVRSDSAPPDQIHTARLGPGVLG